MWSCAVECGVLPCDRGVNAECFEVNPRVVILFRRVYHLLPVTLSAHVSFLQFRYAVVIAVNPKLNSFMKHCDSAEKLRNSFGYTGEDFCMGTLFFWMRRLYQLFFFHIGVLKKYGNKHLAYSRSFKTSSSLVMRFIFASEILCRTIFCIALVPIPCSNTLCIDAMDYSILYSERNPSFDGY